MVTELNPGNPINDQHSSAPRNRSKFNLSYVLAQTARFGELTPHYVEDAVSGDVLPLNSAHSLNTFTLKAPLRQNLSIKRDYFAVPRQAILPFQWDRFKTIPNIGQDVPDDCGTTVTEFYRKLDETIKARISKVSQESTPLFKVRAFLNLLNFCEYFLSDGSLLNYLGCNCGGRFVPFKFTKDNITYTFTNFDQYFDFAINEVVVAWLNAGDSSTYFEITPKNTLDASKKYRVYLNPPTDQSSYLGDRVTIRTFLERLRDDGWISAIGSNLATASIPSSITTFINNFCSNFTINSSRTELMNDKPVDLARLFAYQIVCAHYYSNDKVDYIYSAELYRQNVRGCIMLQHTTPALQVFDWNGLKLQYDYLSAHYFDIMMTGLQSYESDYMYFALIFGFRNSLRFVDYFTGARTRPLAVGDTSVDVNNSKVQVIDVTRNIQFQRLLNAVNRSGRKLANQVKTFIGVSLPQDYHDPIYLGHTSDNVFADEVQNTGDSQMSDANSITSNLRSNSSRYCFEYYVELDSVVLGISYFDIPRLYSRSTDRQMMHVNRYDMFNPFLEFIGDQEIMSNEVSSDILSSEPFGYTSRYMEYKQRVSRAVGGFARNLPGYVFLADNVPGLPTHKNISPSYIRSHNVELDEFYTSLTGYSLGSYFHFMVINHNNADSSRPMSYDPKIL